jgi:conjugative relaxase-like TrwC/TraI family protein
MLSVTPVSAGTAGVNYLLEQAGCPHEHEAPTQHREDPEHAGVEYLTKGEEKGEAAGRWLGGGLKHLGLTPGTVADADTVRQVFGRLEDPQTGQRLGRAPYQYKSPTARLAELLELEPNASPERVAELTWQVNSTHRQAVGYFDLTFSPVKSVSLYYAGLLQMGRVDDAMKVWEAHRAAVDAAFSYFQREAGYSRAGYHGRTQSGRSVGDYVEARNWIAARFDHTTNREHEPQLHSHTALLNRVRCETDQKWRTLDSKALFHEKRGADSIYELELETRLMESGLPVEFGIRPDGKAREIRGINDEQRAMVSTRRQQVVNRVAEMVTEYNEKNGRQPTPYDLTIMHQEATKETRAAKTGPMSAEELKQHWAKHGEMLRAAVASAEAAGRASAGKPTPGIDREAITRAAVHQLQESRASWTRSDLMLSLKQQLPGRVAAEGGPTSEAFITGLADEALRPGGPYGILKLTAPEPVAVPPEMVRQSDGRPTFRPHRDERYCTEGQMAAEDRLVTTARELGAPQLDESQLLSLEAALLSRKLGDDQRAAVLGVMGSGRLADVLIGPAGTGKSYTTGAIQEAWETFHGPVLGLATGQNAANVLTEEGLSAQNIAQFLAQYEAGGRDGLPQRQLPPGALLVIDETGMSATEQLDRVRQVAQGAGAKMLFTGDHQQLDSVGAGGALRLLAEDVPTFELREVRRFQQPWEMAASLGVRDGDINALREYDNRGRIFEGTQEQMLQQAYQAYLADTIEGKRSLLLVGSNAEASSLSAQARAEMVRLGMVQPDGSVLRDGNLAGVGDLVQTRQGDRNLRDADGRHFVANRDVWKVTGRDEQGLKVQLERDPTVELTLPQDYVEKSVTLAYASTSHAAQGRTVDTGHSVVDVSMSRNELYPNMTRGKEGNWLYTVTHQGPDDERGNQPFHSDRVSVLTDVLERDTAQRAATQVMREELADAGSLASLGSIWQRAITDQSRDRYADALLDVLGPERMDRLAHEDGAGRLWRAARNAELAGVDATAALREVAERGQLDDAGSLSDVLRFRLSAGSRDGRGENASWAARTPEVDTEVGRYTQQLAELMDARQHELGELAAEDPPTWALEHLGPVPADDPVAAEDWRQRAGAVAGWRELSNVQGPSALGSAPSREMPDMRAAWHAAYTALGTPEAGRDYAAASDDELRAMVSQYERDQEWAPAHVAPRLRQAEQNATTYRHQSTLWRADGEATTDEAQRAEKLARAEQKATIAAAEAALAEKLTTVHEARQLWSEEHKGHEHAADMSQRELDRRSGTDPDSAPSPQAAPDAGRTMADIEAEVARAQEATERILTDRAAAAQASAQRLLDEPQHQHSAPEHAAPEQPAPEQTRGDDGGMER